MENDKMQPHRKQHVSKALLLRLVLVTGSSLSATAQADDRVTGLAAAVKQANADAESRYKQSVREWRHKFGNLGSKQRLRRMGQDLASFDEKLAQGVDLFRTTGARNDRILLSFRKRLFDEHELFRSMQKAFNELQQELATESTALYVQKGISRVDAATTIPLYRISSNPWNDAFVPLLNDARSMAKEDWLRYGAVTVGSTAAAKLLTDAARESGAWDSPQNSLESLLGGLLAEMVIETVADELSDPVDYFADRLGKHFAAAEKQLLDGRNGLLSAMRKITSLHQQTRLQHLTVNEKGGK